MSSRSELPEQIAVFVSGILDATLTGGTAGATVASLIAAGKIRSYLNPDERDDVHQIVQTVIDEIKEEARSDGASGETNSAVISIREVAGCLIPSPQDYVALNAASTEQTQLEHYEALVAQRAVAAFDQAFADKPHNRHTLQTLSKAAKTVIARLKRDTGYRQSILLALAEDTHRHTVATRDDVRAIKADTASVREGVEEIRNRVGSKSATDNAEHADRKSGWARIHDKIRAEPEKAPRGFEALGDGITQRALAIELGAYRVKGGGWDADYRGSGREKKKKKATFCWLREAVTGWFHGNGPDALIVSGGPGSGKSTFSRLFAADMIGPDGLHVFRVPLHLLRMAEPGGADALAGVLERRWKRAADLTPPESTSPNLFGLDVTDRLLLVLDGLDELAAMGKTGLAAVEGLAEHLHTLLEQENGEEPGRVKALLLGRDLAAERCLSG